MIRLIEFGTEKEKAHQISNQRFIKNSDYLTSGEIKMSPFYEINMQNFTKKHSGMYLS